jgi:hypothetical protein
MHLNFIDNLWVTVFNINESKDIKLFEKTKIKYYGNLYL